jgi:two-component system cell cycle response regulator
MSAQILVVDNNRTNLDLMLYLLRAFGHRPAAASDGLAGLEEARRRPYDLILCDVLMAGIDGFEFARRLKADPQLQHVQVVAVTALAMPGDRDRVMAAGFDGCIAKPIDPETFVMRVDAYLPPELQSIAAGNSMHVSAGSGEDAESTGPIVLAVDDVQANLDVIGRSLRPFGFRVVEANSVHDAYELARQTRPSIILCDVHMKEGDGFNFVRKIKADPELQDVPFLFITSTAWRTADKACGIELGAEKFIQRPIDPALLLEEVERVVRDLSEGEGDG